MRRFLTAIVAFSLVPLVYMATMAIWNLDRMGHEAPALTHATVLLGDSHIGCALDTTVLTRAQNTALPAEPYLLSWLKLRKFTAVEHIDTIILGFAPHNLSDKDHAKFRDEGWATDRLMLRAYPLLTMTEAWHLPLARKSYLRTLFREFCLQPTGTHVHYLGSFIRMGNVHHPDSSESIARHFLQDGTTAPLSSLGISYLDSIITLCRREKIQLVLLGTPLHPSYLRNIPSMYTAAYDSLTSRLRAQGVLVVDATSHFVSDSLFANSDHLSGQGAALFSRQLPHLMKEAGRSRKGTSQASATDPN